MTCGHQVPGGPLATDERSDVARRSLEETAQQLPDEDAGVA